VCGRSGALRFAGFSLKRGVDATLGLSVRTGEQISGRFIAAQLAPTPENVRAILMGMNHDFVCQYLMLLLGLLVMFAWLIWFLVWWIFFETKGSEKKQPAIPPSRATSGD